MSLLLVTMPFVTSSFLLLVAKYSCFGRFCLLYLLFEARVYARYPEGHEVLEGLNITGRGACAGNS